MNPEKPMIPMEIGRYEGVRFITSPPLPTQPRKKPVKPPAWYQRYSHAYKS